MIIRLWPDVPFYGNQSMRSFNKVARKIYLLLSVKRQNVPSFLKHLFKSIFFKVNLFRSAAEQPLSNDILEYR